MTVRTGLAFMIAASLLVRADPATAQAAAQLPGGNDGIFRAKMLDWSAPDAVSAPAAASPVYPERIMPTQPRTLPRLSSRFGDRRHPVDGRVRHHAGIDIPGRAGTPIMAAASGVVRRAGWAGGYGIMVELVHEGGLSSRYAHLSRALVPANAVVARGQVIGAMGSTGRSTGNHLHFEVRRAGVALDPLGFLSAAQMLEPQPVAPLEPLAVHRSQFARMRDVADWQSGTGR